MTNPYSRQPEPVMFTGGWELPVLLLAGGFAVIALAALVGIGVARAFFGAGWIWPSDTPTALRLLGSLLNGHPRVGPASPASPADGPGPVVVYVCVVACELTAIALGIWVGTVVSRFRRPRDQRAGMATRHEAAQALGVHQLRAVRTIIRPDRYSKEAVR